MPDSSHTYLARFVAGACSLTASAAAGNAMAAVTTGIAISNPAGIAILGTLAAFAGGAAIYKGRKQNQSDDQIFEIHTYLEQLIQQQGNLASALANLPEDLPLSHAGSCDRIRQIATIFAPGSAGIQDRLQANAAFASFANESMQSIENSHEAQEADLNRLIQMAFDAKVLSEDQVKAIDSVSQSLGLLHEKADKTLDTTQRTERKVDQIADYFMAQLQSKEDHIASLQSENTSLRDNVHAAIERVAQVEQDAGRDPLIKLDQLRKGDPHKLLTFLDDQLDIDEQEFIEKHHERVSVAYVLGELAKAEQSLSKILALQPHDLVAINYLGVVCRLKGDFPKAEMQYKRLLDLDDSQESRAIAFGNLGAVEYSRGNFDTAEDYFKRSLEIDESIGRKEGMANDLNNLGCIERERGDLDTARVFCERSLLISESLGYKEGMANALGNLGGIECICGNLDVGEGFYKHSLVINESLGWKRGMASALGNLGVVECERGNLDAGESYHERSLVIEEFLDDKEGMAKTLSALGVIERLRDNLDAGERYHKRSLEISEFLDCKVTVSSTLCNLGVIELCRKNFDAGECYLKRSLEMQELIGCTEDMASTLMNLGLIEHMRGNSVKAKGLWIRSRNIFIEFGSLRMAGKNEWLIEYAHLIF